MNIVLTPKELLMIYQSLIQQPSQEVAEHKHLVSKLYGLLLGYLDSEEERRNKETYKNWSENEIKKIDELKKLNREILPVPKTTKRK